MYQQPYSVGRFANVDYLLPSRTAPGLPAKEDKDGAVPCPSLFQERGVTAIRV
jgi:hypothetical protein